MATKYLTFPKLSKQAITRFWSKVKIRSLSECWHWKAGRKEKGYGVFCINYHMYRAHRVSYFLHYEQDPKGFDVCHKCDNPRCVNPTHLFLATNAGNMRDKIQKGRQRRGQTMRRAKLNPDSVRLIRKLYKTGEYTQEALAQKFKVHRGSIQQVLDGRTWKHV